jgi:hypothetical protein
MVGLPGYLLAASLAWNPDDNPLSGDAAMAACLDLWAFDAVDGGPARALLTLADLYRLPGGSTFNGSPLFYLLTRPDLRLDGARLGSMTQAGLEATLGRLDGLADDDGLAAVEAAWIHRALGTASRIGLARLRHRATASCRELPGSSRRRLAGELDGLIEEHRALWLRDSRPGGLGESARFLERTRDALAGHG